MRIDGFSSSSYSLDRSARTGTAVTPYGEVKKGVEARPETPKPAQPARVEASSEDRLPITAQSLTYQRPLNAYAAQALASYGSTASYSTDVDALEVLGLDLYA
ncbi:hypothetical protein [Zestomonas carbonaria]|uniref:Uncharacterized protein n=1 Tax=Zestomonas carbonaria TaxID=2762745 RepID=A0A7U7EM41_9GAMM|nr:hypothetical protein [Pseudomonas carbonaria]CAD5107543.1 hypothetical protein PSEWESI4_01816 [Pseudomonas carbonaria]